MHIAYLVQRVSLRFNSVPSAMFTSFRCFTDGCSDYKGSPWRQARCGPAGDGGEAQRSLMMLDVSVYA